MISQIVKIKQRYSNGTLNDGITAVVLEKDGKCTEHLISGTEWTTRCAEQIFDVAGIPLVQEQIAKINRLLFGV